MTQVQGRQQVTDSPIRPADEAMVERVRNILRSRGVCVDTKAIADEILATLSTRQACNTGPRDTDWTVTEDGVWLARNRDAILAALRTDGGSDD